jgi:hypothetical protein
MGFPRGEEKNELQRHTHSAKARGKQRLKEKTIYPPSPTWISKLFEGGKGAVIAGIVFGYWLGQTMAKDGRNHW